MICVLATCCFIFSLIYYAVLLDFSLASPSRTSENYRILKNLANYLDSILLFIILSPIMQSYKILSWLPLTESF